MSCLSSRTAIAQGPTCTVESCACGTLHLSFGPVTLRVAPEVVLSIWETLGEALRRMGIHRRSSSASTDPFGGDPFPRARPGEPS